MSTIIQRDLASRRCKPLKGAEHGLSLSEVKDFLAQLPSWVLADDGKSISRHFSFKNYYQTMAFANAVAWIAHEEDHHPDMEVTYNQCRLRYSTHDVGGLSENDFVCAAKVEGLRRS